MKSIEVADGKIRFKRRLVKRYDGSGYILNLPSFIGSFGRTAVVEVDTNEKVIVIKLEH